MKDEQKRNQKQEVENEEIYDFTLEEIEANEKYVKEGFFSKIKKGAAKIPFVLDAVSMYYCAIDQKTPIWAKGIALGALAYFILPVDTIPDGIPVLGLTDDAGVVTAALAALEKNITNEHKDKANIFMNGENFAPGQEA